MNNTSTLPLPPGRFGLPFVGETIGFLRNANFVRERVQKHGPIFKTHILGRPTVVMVGAEANRFVLSKGMEHFSWGEGWPKNFKELLGHSLFVQDGAEHQRNRQLIAPAFHRSALVSYMQMMEEIICSYLAQWEALGQFAWFTEFKKMTFDVASTLLIGSQPGEDTARLSQYFSDLTNGLFALPLRWRWTTYGKALLARDSLLAYVEEQVRQRQQEPQSDALGMLVQSVDEEGNHLSMEELKAQAILLLFAGHETTTSMLTSFCMALAQQPEVWERARAEQAQIELDRPPTYAQVQQMTYLNQILREVERLYAPVRGGFRGVIKPFEFNGYHVPKGWQLQYNILATHLDGEIYPQPDDFNPDRFDSQQKGQKSPFNLVGFGGGPRVCIGKTFALLEIKLVAAHLLRHYSWELLPEQDLTLSRIPTTRPRDNLQVSFRRR